MGKYLNIKLRNSLLLIFVGIIIGVIIVSNLDFTDYSFAESEQSNKTNFLESTTPISKSILNLKETGNTFTQIAKLVNPTVVSIQTETRHKTSRQNRNRFYRFFDGNPHEQIPSVGLGSGVIVDKNGYILTNHHVIENADKIEVNLNDRRTFRAKVIGVDPYTDLAVIKIDGEDLPVAYLGNSDNIDVGEWVLAIGNPLGLNSTVTAGIVSALGRDINIVGNNLSLDDRRYSIETFIQTDAAINPGNSGGALVNLGGEVIGIDTAIATRGGSGSYIGYGFAIPLHLAKNVMNDVIAYGRVRRGWIGVSIRPVDQTDAKAFGLDNAKGVLITGLVRGSAAEKAKLQEEDIILQIEGQTVNNPNEIQAVVAQRQPGDIITLNIVRDNKEMVIKIELKERDDS